MIFKRNKFETIRSTFLQFEIETDKRIVSSRIPFECNYAARKIRSARYADPTYRRNRIMLAKNVCVFSGASTRNAWKWGPDRRRCMVDGAHGLPWAPAAELAAVASNLPIGNATNQHRRTGADTASERERGWTFATLKCDHPSACRLLFPLPLSFALLDSLFIVLEPFASLAKLLTRIQS